MSISIQDKFPKLIYIFLLILILLCTVSPISASAQTDTLDNTTENDFITPGDDLENATITGEQNNSVELIVRFKSFNPSTHTANATVERLRQHAVETQQSFRVFAAQTDGVTVKDSYWIMNSLLVDINTQKINISNITQQNNVTKIHKNYNVSLPPESSFRQADSSPNVQISETAGGSNGATYGIDQISAPYVWEKFNAKGDNVTVAVLDTGVDTANHSGIRVRSGGWNDFINTAGTPYDNNGHGTHVSGTLVGNKMSDGTHFGVAPDAELLHGKVFNKYGSSNVSLIVAGIEWAVVHDADVISMSLGGQPGVYIEDFVKPIQHARDAGVIFVGVAGNSGVTTSSSPGNVYNVFSTGATDKNRSVATFSGGEQINTTIAWGFTAPANWPSRYTVPTVAAPGVNIRSSAAGGGYVTKSGTSMAAPHAAGTIALVQSATDEQLTTTEIKRAIKSTASTPTQSKFPNNRYGHGVINASAATLAVADSAAYTITRFSPPTLVVSNTGYTARAQVKNAGDASDTQNVTDKLASNGTKIYTNTTRVKLNGGNSTTVRMTIPPTATTGRNGSYTHILETEAERQTRQVAIGSSPIPIGAVYTANSIVATYDRDRDGKINQTELGTGGQAYLVDTINQTQLGKLGQAYLAS
jgi:subtilisin family serine protease